MAGSINQYEDVQQQHVKGYELLKRGVLVQTSDAVMEVSPFNSIQRSWVGGIVQVAGGAVPPSGNVDVP